MERDAIAFAGRDLRPAQPVRARGSAFLLLPWLAILVCFGSSGCGRDVRPARVIVLGIDGLDPDVVDLLISEGRLPNFRLLRERGASGRLLSSKPLLSPIIWTTIATGKTPDEHRIAHFVALNEKTGEQLPVTSAMRKSKALWNILSEHERSVAVVGWWATWPAETVNGTIVSDHTCYHFLFAEGQSGASDGVGIVHPPDRSQEIEALVRRPDSLRFEELAPFATLTREEFERPFDFADPLGHFKWALATAGSYARIGLHLWEADTPDVLMVYIEAVDSTSHLFGHLFRAKGLAGELAAQQQRYGQTVERMYDFADEIVGEYLDALDGDTTLLVVSDHGFQLGVLHDDPSRTRDMRRVSERFHRMEGVFYAYGRRVHSGRRVGQPRLVDVAPTVLALVGIDPARDMPGRVLHTAVDVPAKERLVDSFESSGRVADDPGDAREPRVDEAIAEHLRQLGYLEAVSPKGGRNLAGGLFEAGRYEEAAAAYAKLVAANPDDAGLRASYGGVLGSLGRYAEARRELTMAIELDPLNVEAYHNRGLIFEREGNLQAAEADYRSALRYRADYEPSREGLRRLGVAATPQEPQSANLRLASLLADQASDAARHGNYALAMQRLDEAERIAPELALVHQYRANVEFLRGDREAAIEALERALELEPDNALYRTNLERLHTPDAPSSAGR